jgi:hypothetical protein
MKREAGTWGGEEHQGPTSLRLAEHWAEHIPFVVAPSHCRNTEIRPVEKFGCVGLIRAKPGEAAENSSCF